MKDNFSAESDKYAKYRPGYPERFFEYLNTLVLNKQKAWDCGTGNGQVAYQLANTFEEVYATDISQQQINNARLAPNISYSVQPAEKTSFENNTFDLIVVAQAIHWFNFSSFYAEAKRTAKPNAWICVLGYGRLEISAEIDAIITRFYHHTIGAYWDKERKYIDENYQSIPFPFAETETPEFVNTQYWTLEHLMGYLNTWSAVKHFIKENNYNPLEMLQNNIEKVWGNEPIQAVHFPLLLRLGRIEK